MPNCPSRPSSANAPVQAVTTFVLVAIALAIVNAIIAIALQSGRLLFAAARDEALPAAVARPLARVSPTTKMPIAATIVMGVIALAACFIPFDVLLNATGSTLAFSYGFIALAALVVRRTSRSRRPPATVCRSGCTAVVRAHRDHGDLRDRHPRPRAVAEPRHRIRHRRGRIPLLRALPAPQPVPCTSSRATTTRSSPHDARHPHHRRPRAHVRPGAAVGRGGRHHRRSHRLRRCGGGCAGRPTLDRRDRPLVTPGIIDSHNHLLLGFDEDAVSLEGRTNSPRCAAGSPSSRHVARTSTGCAPRTRCTRSSRTVGRTQTTSTGSPDRSGVRHDLRPALGVAEPGGPPGARHRRGRRHRVGPTRARPGDGRTDRLGHRLLHECDDRAGLAALQRDIPMYSPDRRYRKLVSSMRMATSLGITTVVEPQVPLAELPLFERALAEGVLTSRVIAALFHPVGADAAFRARCGRRSTMRHGDGGCRGAAAPRPGEAVRRRRDRAAHRAHARGLREPPGRARPPELPRRPRAHRHRQRARPHGIPDAHPRHGRRGHPARARRDRAGGAVNGTVDRRHGIVHVDACIPTTCRASRRSG